MVVGAAIGAASLGLALFSAFGPGDETSLDIKQMVNNLLVKTEKQTINLITQSVVDITHNIVQQQLSRLTNNIDSQNRIDLTDVVILGGKFSLEQQNNIKSTVSAIMNIVQSNDLITQLTNQIRDNLTMSLIQNTDLSNQIAATNEVLKAQKTSGEFNNLINSTSDMIKPLMGMFNNKTNRTKIINELSNKLILDNETRANINNYVSQKINQTINQSTLNNCVQTNNAFNEINLNKILVEDTESSFETIQENILISFYRCIVSSLMKTQLLIDLSNNIITDATMSGTQSAKVLNESKTGKKTEDLSTTTSFLDSLSSMIGIIVIIIIIYITRQFTK